MQSLNRIPLNGLRAVEVAGRLGTLARAAAELGVSPGAVSQQILKTERQLGRVLFTRTARGLEPTEIGRAVVSRLTAGFAELARGVALAEARESGILTVTVAPVLAAKWLVPRLARFAAAHPEIRLRLDASVDWVDLDRAGIDVAIRVGRGDWPAVRAEKLLPQRIFPACAPALAERLARPTDLCGLPIIRDAGARHQGTPIRWDAWLAYHGLTDADLGPGPEFSDAALCLDAAVAGQGVMLAWELLAADALADGRLVAPFPERVAIDLAYWLVTPAGRRPAPAVRAFADWLRAEIAAIAEP
ncbi:MAG: LysR family transcriptional regulator [Alphaproteobacteria bacterium]|jgi:DNA-binding transcriptional LysR family regulator|nr:LysR family transcriptional regulator [Alphaproteobacteria bacterium]